MNKAKIFSLLIFVLLFQTCEKAGILENYYPKPECSSDWLTNSYYHLPADKPVQVKNPPASFTANINGKPWRADSLITARYYERELIIQGYNKDYWIGITVRNNDFAAADISIFNRYRYFSKVLEKEINNVAFDTITGTTSLSFKAKIEVKDYSNYPPLLLDPVVIEDGKINNVRTNELFCRPDYFVQKTQPPLKGIWHLIEITDCNTNTQYYPPCGSDPVISFDTLNWGYSGEIYDHHVSAWIVNEFSPTYKFLNDTIIVISGGAVTQVGALPEVSDYEYLFFRSLSRDTMTIKQNKNLLEIKKRNNIFLRFYKL